MAVLDAANRHAGGDRFDDLVEDQIAIFGDVVGAQRHLTIGVTHSWPGNLFLGAIDEGVTSFASGPTTVALVVAGVFGAAESLDLLGHHVEQREPNTFT